MRFTVSKRDFANHVKETIKGIYSKKDQPILKTFLMEAKEDEVLLTSHNKSISIQSKTKAHIEEEGKICVDAKLLESLLKKIKLKAKENVDILCYMDNKDLAIEVNGSVTKLKTMITEDFPEIHWHKEGTPFSLNTDDVKESIKQVSFSTVKNESRPILSGVLWEVNQESLKMVSTDGHRMSLKVLQVSEGDMSMKKIIPVDALNVVEKVVSSYKKNTLETTIGVKEAVFEVDNVQLKTSFIEEDYLNYERIFNMNAVSTITVNKSTLSEVLERASIFIPKDNIASITCKCEADMLYLDISSATGQLTDSIESKMVGEPIEITFNISYLITALQKINEEEVNFYFINKTSPMIMEGKGNPSYKHMLLPIIEH